MLVRSFCSLTEETEQLLKPHCNYLRFSVVCEQSGLETISQPHFCWPECLSLNWSQNYFHCLSSDKENLILASPELFHQGITFHPPNYPGLTCTLDFLYFSPLPFSNNVIMAFSSQPCREIQPAFSVISAALQSVFKWLTPFRKSITQDIYMTFQFLTKWHFNMAHRAIKRPRKTYMHSQSEACLDLKLVNPSPSLSLRNNELFLCLGCICILLLTPSKATGRAWFIFC